ncbi:hypothetical protein BJ741DRAFT_583905 [Chytriomyces cf. hyalinus JEL632]|nr:hypothetical protein BJ741DRAFT_583905 [Chytriomyces cf. hyalinus JEL632]
MLYTTHLAWLLIAAAVAAAEKTVNIGILKRIPDAECLHRVKSYDQVSIHYIASVHKRSDSVFDQDYSPESGKTLEFVVGAPKREFAEGLDRGVMDMCVGERRRLVVPPELGYLPDPVYGYSGGQKAPYGVSLVFDVELVSILNKSNPSREEL